MHADIPVEDMTHENYWRQLLRWLVDGVPDHVETHTSADRVEAGETVTITADVVDPTFVEINDARVVAHVDGPKGIVDVPLQWTGERSGEYRGTFVAPDEGLYTARVEATRGDDGARHRRHAAPRRSRRRRVLRRRHARRHGCSGSPRTPAASSTRRRPPRALPEDMRYSGRGVTTTEERDLWHMPIVLGLILLLMCGEWGYRRAVGLA